MDATTRKEREVAEREQLFLDVARSILLERGYLGLTMDRIADATEYSKGTVYLHFANKEEVVAALGARIAAAQLDLMRRGAAFDGRPRERILAIGMAYGLWASLYPDDIRLTQIVKSSSVRGKVSATILDGLETIEDACSASVVGVVQDAIDAGDLSLEPPLAPGHIAHALWSMHWGAHTLSLLDVKLEKLGVEQPLAMLERHAHALLDGYGWQPLFAAWDWDEVKRRLQTEVFATELARLRAEHTADDESRKD